MFIQCNRSVVATQRAYRQNYRGRSAPKSDTIRRLASNFENHGSVADRPHSTRPRPQRSNENIEGSVAEDPNMLRRTMAEFDIPGGLQHVLKKIEITLQKRPQEITAPAPILVAVSKTKPAECIIEAYNAGQRHFGENYVQELVEKSQHPDILSKCPDIKWHLIGHLQSNKINKVLQLPNLHMIQTVDSENLAKKLDTAWSKLQPNKPLRVLIQINTSEEDVKSGIEANASPSLYQYISTNLKNLQPEGIMTIGAYGFDYSNGPNPDFVKLMEVHRAICQTNNLPADSVKVSMGMSNDYDKAIEMGSTIVRVGTAIFGYRAAKA